MIEPPQIEKPKDRTLINIETQKQLARLLATEDIRVTIGNYKTAYFDVKNRVLGLPAWNTDEKSVSDLLVGHEVGHALFTPEDSISRFKERFPNLPFDIANVVEDVRIERMIQLKYPGLVKSFNDGYRYFKDNDIFQIDGKDVNKFNFIDRLNLKAKLRHLIDIDFSDVEQALFDKCYACKTFDDVLDVIQEIADFIEDEKRKEENQKQDDQGEESEVSYDNNSDDGDDPSSDNSTTTDLNENTEESETPETSGENNEFESSEDSSGGDDSSSQEPSLENFDPEYISETQEAVNDHLEELSELDENEIILNDISDETINRLIIPIEDVRKIRKASYAYDDVMNNSRLHENWLSFRNKTKKSVTLLCKEFERRKAASQYARATQSRTGTINVNKLHSYKFDDQIFKSITNLADAKNHGMNIFIDASGSMGGCFRDVIKQTIQLATFCKMVNIPFKVYSFTSLTSFAYGCRTKSAAENNNAPLCKRWKTRAEFKDEACAPGFNLDLFNVNIVELLNSDLKKNEYEKALKELYIQSGQGDYDWHECYIPCTHPKAGERQIYLNAQNIFESWIEEMGGTPLNETLLVADRLINKFKKSKGVQKMIGIFLTDGAGNCPSLVEKTPEIDLEENENYYGNGILKKYSTKMYIKMGNATVNIGSGDERNAVYANLIKTIKKNNNVRMIGFYLTSRVADGKQVATQAYETLNKKKSWLDSVRHVDQLKEKAKKMKSNCYVVENGFAYDSFFIIDDLKNLKINEEDEFTVPEGVDTENLGTASNRNKLVTSFKKFNTTKRQSKIFLNKFIETII